MKEVPPNSKEFILSLDVVINNFKKVLSNNIAVGLKKDLEKHKSTLIEIRKDLTYKAQLVAFDDFLEDKKVLKKEKKSDIIIKADELDALSENLDLLKKLKLLGFTPLEIQIFSEQSVNLAEYIVEHFEVLCIFLDALRSNSKQVTIHTRRTRLNQDGKLRRELLKRLNHFTNQKDNSKGLIDKLSVSGKDTKKEFWAPKWEFKINNKVLINFLRGHWLSCFVNSTLVNQLKASLSPELFESLTLFRLKGAPEYGIGEIEFDVLAMVKTKNKRIICIECKTGNLNRVIETELEKTVGRREALISILKGLGLKQNLLDFYFVSPPPYTNSQISAFKSAKDSFKKNNIEFISFTELRPMLNRKYAKF